MNMKLIIVLCLVAAVAASSAPRTATYSQSDVRLLSSENVNTGSGGYKFGYAQTDGTKVSQSGYLKNEGLENESIAVTGSFTWIAPNGIRYTVTYTADEEGYNPDIEEGPGGVDPNILASLAGG